MKMLDDLINSNNVALL